MTLSTRVATERTSPGTGPVPGARVDGGALPVPARADGVQLLGEMPGSGYRRPPALVRRADGQTITLTPLLYLLLKAVDGRRGYDTLAVALTAALGRRLTPDDVSFLVERKLRPLGLLRSADGSQPVTRRANPLLALRLKVVVTRPEATRRLTAPFAWLFHPAVALPALVVFALTSWWLLVDKGLASATHQTFYDPVMVLTVWALVLLSAGFHEFGHAAACRYGGAQPGVMGAGLYLVWPAFYTEVSDSYRLGRGGRLRVDLGGLYFNALFALGTLTAWWMVRWDALLLVVAAQHLQMVKQLAPFIRADGYHIVADLIGVPDLFAHIKPTLRSVLPRRWRPQQAPALKVWARAVVVVWVATVVPLLVLLVGGAVLILPRLAATAWDSMNLQWDGVAQYWAEGDVAGVTVRALSSVVVALPVLALLYLLARMGRRTATRLWAATEGDPKRRAGAWLLGAAVAGALVWAWWPADQYEPIRADEEGTLPSLVKVEDHRIFLPLLRAQTVPMRPAPATLVPAYATTYLPPVGTAQVAGQPVGTSGRLASSTPTTGDVPAPGVVETGATTVEGEGSQEWPFPFPSPMAPREGDNRAMAVNTTDGSVVTDLAVSWAIVTANEVDQRNEAWALASCSDCITRAVAFQVLLIISGADAVAPVNIAAAANYECDTCTTEALAVQLVVTLTGMPSEQAQAEIAAVMAQVEALEQDLDSLTSGQIYFLLQASQAQILAILERDGTLPDLGLDAPAEGTTDAPELASASDAAGAEGSTATTSTSPDGSDTSAGSEPTATEPTADSGSDSTAEPTAEPTGEATTEPTTEPTATETTEATASGTESTTTSEPSPTDEPTTSTSP